MDLKIVSGILITRGHKEGRVVIDFARNEIVDGDLEHRDLSSNVIVAPREPVDLRSSYFDQTPCTTVGLREIKTKIMDHDDFGSRPPEARIDQHQINSTVNETRLTISWKAVSGEVEEITYLAIGPVSTPRTGPY